jgi:hypothetical protein
MKQIFNKKKINPFSFLITDCEKTLENIPSNSVYDDSGCGQDLGDYIGNQRLSNHLQQDYLHEKNNYSIHPTGK